MARLSATRYDDAIVNHGKATMVGFILWLLLLVFCWPLAVLALVLYPLVWLISLPFRLVGITLHAAFALLREVLFLPARLLGGGRRLA